MPAPEGNPTTDEKTTNPSMTSLLSEHWELARKLRSLQIVFHPDRCKGVWQCYEVCPVAREGNPRAVEFPRTLLDQAGVKYLTAPSLNPVEPAVAGAAAKRSTVIVECW